MLNLSMAESVVREAHCLSYEKASFQDTAVQGLRPRLQASTEKFQAHVNLTLLFFLFILFAT